MSQEEFFSLVEDDDEVEVPMILEDVNPSDLGISEEDQKEFGFCPRNEDIEAAKKWITLFFKGKQMYYGGDIPPAVIYSPAYIDKVLNLDIVKGIKEAYDLIEITGAIETSCDEDSVPTDVSIVVGLLEECHRLGIPKFYAAGIVLMALELCHGVTPPMKLAASGF